MTVRGMALGLPPDVQIICTLGNDDRGNLEVSGVEFIPENSPAIVARGCNLNAQPGIDIAVFIQIVDLQSKWIAPFHGIRKRDSGSTQRLSILVRFDKHMAYVAADHDKGLAEPVPEFRAGIDHPVRRILPAHPQFSIIIVVQLIAVPMPNHIRAVIQPDLPGAAGAGGVEADPDVFVRPETPIIHVHIHAEDITAFNPEAVIRRQFIITIRRRGDGHAIDIARRQVVGGQDIAPAVIPQVLDIRHRLPVIDAVDVQCIGRLYAFIIQRSGRFIGNVQLVARFDHAIKAHAKAFQSMSWGIVLRQRCAPKQAGAEQRQGQPQAQQLPIAIPHLRTILSSRSFSLENKNSAHPQR